MLTQIITKSITNIFFQPLYSFGIKQAKPVKSLKQRLKYYARKPDEFKLITRIRPPDLTDANIKFPIRIPVRYRHRFCLNKKKLRSLDNDSRKIHWGRLQPNQILLAFQNTNLLTFNQTVQGLRYLSEIKGQQQYDWNKHQWVSQALNKVRDNFNRIKKVDFINFYFLMKKLRYTDQTFWKKIYAKIQQNIYDLKPKIFQYMYITYGERTTQFFSPQSKQKFQKLMQGRLRQFSAEAIIQVFQRHQKHKKIDNYWLQNVFISLFKNMRYKYTSEHIIKIFKSMMLLGHQNNDRLYDNLYKRIKQLKFTSLEELEKMEQTMLQVKQIFTSHRVQPVLQVLQEKRVELEELKQQVKKKTIQQMVKDDLRYFIQKKKLKAQQKGKKNQDKTNAQPASAPATA